MEIFLEENNNKFKEAEERITAFEYRTIEISNVRKRNKKECRINNEHKGILRQYQDNQHSHMEMQKKKKKKRERKEQKNILRNYPKYSKIDKRHEFIQTLETQ